MKLTKQFNILNKYNPVFVNKDETSNWYFNRGIRGCVDAMKFAKEKGGKAYLASSNSLSGMKAIQLWPKIRHCHLLHVPDEAGLI
jgi:hypothetical protein